MNLNELDLVAIQVKISTELLLIWKRLNLVYYMEMLLVRVALTFRIWGQNNFWLIRYDLYHAAGRLYTWEFLLILIDPFKSGYQFPMMAFFIRPMFLTDISMVIWMLVLNFTYRLIHMRDPWLRKVFKLMLRGRLLIGYEKWRFDWFKVTLYHLATIIYGP